MLKSSFFRNIQKGIFETVQVVKSEIGDDTNFRNVIKVKKRTTFYLDTPDHGLNKNHIFSISVGMIYSGK